MPASAPLVVGILAACLRPALADDVFVSPKGSDGDDCGSEADPCGSIGQGIAQAAAGSVVRVAPGDYAPEEGQDPYFTVDKSLSIIAEQGATINCDFRCSGADVLVSSFISITIEGLHFHQCSGTVTGGNHHGEPLRPWSIAHSIRDPNCKPEWNSGCNCAIGDCSRAGGVSIIHKGYEKFDDWAQNPSLMQTFKNVQVLFRKCHFTENTANMGGAVQLLLASAYSDSAFTFEDCTFRRNSITRARREVRSIGSAVYQTMGFENTSRLGIVLKQTNLTFRGCEFSDNENEWGHGTLGFVNNNGGRWYNLSIDMSNVTFADNVVEGNGGGVFMLGAPAADADDALNIIRVSQAKIQRNRGTGVGVGGGMLLGTFAYSELEVDQMSLPSNAMQTFDYRTLVEVSDSLFDSNENAFGGGYCAGNGMITFRRTNFTNNTAKQQGGAMVLSLGGGDGGVELHDCILKDNSASISHSIVSQGSGPVLFNSTKVWMRGTQNSRDDINIFFAGEAVVTGSSQFICPAGSTMIIPNSKDYTDVGFSFQTSGPLKPAWNDGLRGVGYNIFSALCLFCPAGRYKILAPKLADTFWTRVCDKKAVHQGIGNCHPKVYWKVDYVGTYVREQTSNTALGDCHECPFGAVCNGGDDVKLSGRNFYGYIWNRKTGRPVYSGARPPDESGPDWVVQLEHCPQGYCLTKAQEWWRTCLAHRSGFLCGTCDRGYSESWFGSGPCVEDGRCRSGWWLGPLLVFAMFGFGMYNYHTAQNGLYTPIDVCVFFFQLYPYVVSSSDPGREQVGPGSAIVGFFAMNFEEAAVNDMSTEGGEASLKAELLCLAPGLSAYNRMIFAGAIKLLVPIFVVLGHFLAYYCGVTVLRPKGKEPAGSAAATGTPARAPSLQEGEVPTSVHEIEEAALRTAGGTVAGPPEPVTPLLAGLYKAFFFCFSGLLKQLFKLATCVEGRHRFAGMAKCTINEELVMWLSSMIFVCAPVGLAILSAVVRRGALIRMSGVVRSVREIQPLHERGMRPGLWWWPFAFATVRGALVLSPIVVNDIALGTALRAGVMGGLVVFSKVVAPFEEEAANSFQSLLFLLLFFASAFSVVFSVLDVEAVNPGEELIKFIRFVVGVNFFTIMAASLVTGQILWARFCKRSGDAADGADPTAAGGGAHHGVLRSVDTTGPGSLSSWHAAHIQFEMSSFTEQVLLRHAT